MKYLKFLILGFLGTLFLGCAPKVVDVATLNPNISVTHNPRISTYAPTQGFITFYEFSLKNGVLVENSWWKKVPTRIDFMPLWTTGLGHDIRRLTNNHAQTLEDALMYNAQQNGMTKLYMQNEEYILDNTFADDIVEAIDDYEEKIRRYDRDWPFRPLRAIPRF